MELLGVLPLHLWLPDNLLYRMGRYVGELLLTK